MRGYDRFCSYAAGVQARLYPWGRKGWGWEPYALGGYAWSTLIPKGSGDRLEGQGWRAGSGVFRPLTRHLLMEVQFVYDALEYRHVQFQGFSGSFTNPIDNHHYSLALLFSWILG